MPFINRHTELQKLEDLWKLDSAQIVVITGKRRVGKTELIKQFLKKRGGLYYLADKRTHRDQLLEFARVVGNYFNDPFISQKGFSDWYEGFSYLKEQAKKKRVVVAIDEYPYLAETDPAVSSIFQKIWDEQIKTTNIYLILCGSSMAMMESELLSYKAPLYGRLTGQLLIEPMDYCASKKFFPKATFETFLSYYAITGGMPAYLQQFKQYPTVEKAIHALCWDKQGLYHNEVHNLLKQELRTPNTYFALLKAIAKGKTRVSEIANDAGLDVHLVNKYIDTLERLQFIRREVPVTEERPYKSKKGVYILTEHFVRFWFQYVFSYASDLEIQNTRQVQKRLNLYGNSLEALAYENIARHHMHLHQSRIFPMDKVGRYWDKITEIDGVGLNAETKQIVFMEAKWINKEVDIRILRKLQQKAKGIEWYNTERTNYYILYSKSGFHSDLIDYARKDKHILLVKQDTFISS